MATVLFLPARGESVINENDSNKRSQVTFQMKGRGGEGRGRERWRPTGPGEEPWTRRAAPDVSTRLGTNVLSNFIWDEVAADCSRPRRGAAPPQAGADGGSDAASARLHLRQQLVVPPSSCCFYPVSRLLSSLYSRHQSFPSLPPRHSCCLGNNTKRFFFAALSPWQRLAFLQVRRLEAAPAGPRRGRLAPTTDRIEAPHWLLPPRRSGGRCRFSRMFCVCVCVCGADKAGDALA